MHRCYKFSLIIMLVVSGCSTPLFAPPTATPTATLTPTNTPALTQTLTAMSTKVLTATPSPVVGLGEKHTIAEAGFSFRVPFGYIAQIEERQAFISDLEGKLVISFASVENNSSLSEEQIINGYLDALAKRSEGIFEKVPSAPIIVEGKKATAFDLAGTLLGSPLKGKTFLLPVGENRFLYGLAITNISEDEAAWEENGSKVFETVIGSLELFEPQIGGTCPIAADDTYGYTQENAIRVGEGRDLFGGPARERAYLDNLRGPNGEPISYERTGSLNFEDTILDEYVINGLATPVTLYVDIYTFEELMAPVGFTCAGPFNLEP